MEDEILEDILERLGALEKKIELIWAKPEEYAKQALRPMEQRLMRAIDNKQEVRVVVLREMRRIAGVIAKESR